MTLRWEAWGWQVAETTGVPFIVQRLEEHTTCATHVEQCFVWISGLQIPTLPLVRTYLRSMGEELQVSTSLPEFHGRQIRLW